LQIKAVVSLSVSVKEFPNDLFFEVVEDYSTDVMQVNEIECQINKIRLNNV